MSTDTQSDNHNRVMLICTVINTLFGTGIMYFQATISQKQLEVAQSQEISAKQVGRDQVRIGEEQVAISKKQAKISEDQLADQRRHEEEERLKELKENTPDIRILSSQVIHDDKTTEITIANTSKVPVFVSGINFVVSDADQLNAIASAKPYNPNDSACIGQHNEDENLIIYKCGRWFDRDQFIFNGSRMFTVEPQDDLKVRFSIQAYGLSGRAFTGYLFVSFETGTAVSRLPIKVHAISPQPHVTLKPIPTPNSGWAPTPTFPPRKFR